MSETSERHEQIDHCDDCGAEIVRYVYTNVSHAPKWLSQVYRCCDCLARIFTASRSMTMRRLSPAELWERDRAAERLRP